MPDGKNISVNTSLYMNYIIFQIFFYRIQVQLSLYYLMRKNFISKQSCLAKVNGKRLNLDKKQSQIILPNLTQKDDNNKKNQQKTFPIQVRNLKSTPIKEKNISIVPFLMKRVYQQPKTSNSLSKLRSRSETLNNKQNRVTIGQIYPIKIAMKLKIQQQQNYYKARPKQKINESHNNSSIFHETTMQQKQQISNICLETSKNQKSLFEKDNYVIDQISNQKNQKKNYFLTLSKNVSQKTFQSVGVSTDLEMNSETYKQFIKFKITQKEKFHKLSQIFQFIDDISNKQNKVFEERYTKINLLYKESLQTDRQTKILQVTKNISKLQKQFMNMLDAFSQNQLKVQKKVLDENIAQAKYLKQFLNNLKKQSAVSEKSQNSNIFSSTSSNYQKSFNNNNFNVVFIDNIFLQFQKFYKSFEQKQYLVYQQRKENIQQSCCQLIKKFQIWKQSLDQKNYLIKTCIHDVLRLPEMSLSIFGLGEDLQTKEEVSLLRKIGVFLDDIPSLDNFSSTQMHSQKVESAFREILNFKCLNCTYLKSKMKYIYKKNTQLKSVIKILNFLTAKQKQSKN